MMLVGRVVARSVFLVIAVLVTQYGAASVSCHAAMISSLVFALAWFAAECAFDAAAQVSTTSSIDEIARLCRKLPSEPESQGELAEKQECRQPAFHWRTFFFSTSHSQLIALREDVRKSVENVDAMRAFIPAPVRVSDKRFVSQNDDPVTSTAQHEPLVDNASFGKQLQASRVGFVAGGGATVNLMHPQDTHIQLLLDAVRNPCELKKDSPPPAPPASPELEAGFGSPAPNASVSSPLLKLSFSGSPKVSPLSVGVMRSRAKGTFRRSESIEQSSSAERSGTVLAVELHYPHPDEADASTAWLPNHEVVVTLSTAIGHCITIASDYGGVVSTFDLTRVLVTFHVQQPCPDHASCAAFAALAMSNMFELLADDGISFGIGLAVGPVLAGDVGTAVLRSCVVHGAVVQEARDLAKLNFFLQTRVLASENLHDMIQSGVVTLLVDFVHRREALTAVMGLKVATDPQLAPDHPLRASSGVFEVRGVDAAAYEESFTEGHPIASRLPHDAQIAYLEAFFFLRKGKYSAACEKLASIVPEVLDADTQVQRLLRLAVFFRDSRECPPPDAYARHRLARWEALEHFSDQTSTLRHASPSFAGRRPGQLSHESPTRIIEAVMRAHSTPQPPSDVAALSGSSDFDATQVSLNLSVSSEFRDVNGILFRKSEKILGKGAFGEVYLGMRVEDGKLVAIKQLHIPEIAASVQPSGRQRRTSQREKHELSALVREIKLLCGLRHPNIVFFLGCGVVNRDILINLEYVSGGSLQTILEEFGALPIASVQRYLKDVLRGIEFLHNKGVIHRDVKPGNVLLHVDGSCKVTDFGTSIQIQSILDNNIVVGTPAYMSPEQARGSLTTCFQSDLWSVGVMTMQLLSGVPHVNICDQFSAMQYMRRLATEESFGIQIPDWLPPLAASFISQCLRRNPSSRGTAAELQLHPFLFSPSTPSHPTPMRKPSTTFSQSSPNSDPRSSPINPST